MIMLDDLRPRDGRGWEREARVMMANRWKWGEGLI